MICQTGHNKKCPTFSKDIMLRHLDDEIGKEIQYRECVGQCQWAFMDYKILHIKETQQWSALNIPRNTFTNILGVRSMD